VKQKQINVRMPADDVGVFEVAAFLEQQSVAEFLKPMLQQLASELRTDPLISATIESRAVKVAQKDGSLARLHDQRRRGGSR
jgi:uncharacterized protein (DUF1778 family)